MHTRRLWGNSVIFNKNELSKEEVYILRSIRSLKETEKYFILSSFKNIWPELDQDLNDHIKKKIQKLIANRRIVEDSADINLIFKPDSLTEEESSLLNNLTSINEMNIYPFHESVESTWRNIEQDLIGKLTNKLREISTNPNKCHFSLSGMEEINIPPYGIIFNPKPNWISLFKVRDLCYIRVKTYELEEYKNDFFKCKAMNDILPLSDYNPEGWKLDELFSNITDKESFLIMSGIEAIFAAAIHCYQRDSFVMYVDQINCIPRVMDYQIGGMRRPHAFFAAIKEWNEATMLNFEEIAQKRCKEWKKDFKEAFSEQKLQSLIAGISEDHHLKQCPWPNVPRNLMTSFLNILKTA
jgi:hypothetical protein